MALVGLYGLLVGLFGLGSVASTEPLLLGTATVQQAWRSERAELEARLLVTEQLVAGRSGLATAHLDSLAPSSEDPGMNLAAFSWFALIYDDLRQPMPGPSIVAIGTAVANSSSWHAVPQQAPRLAGDFSCDCMFRGEREGGYTRQVGPSVDTAIMTTVLSTTLCVSAHTHEHRPYSATLYPTSFTLESLLALTIRARHKTHGWCFTSGLMACGFFFT